MTTPPTRLSDERIDQFIGRVLQAGVVIAGAIVAVAALFYLARYGAATPAFGTFRGEPANLRTVAGIVRGAASLHPRAWIQFGLLILLLTPIARVVLLLGAFAIQRDRLYVAIASVVVLLLILSLAGLTP
ncbi:MAG TPA: DUF1634 domain-containing protein [Gemmatimonadaceae bacterium]|nr:DUF1634 domain-containing protein [Gemmatimonadaceae bacterium]